MRTGGGTSIMPRVAYTLYEFVPFDEYLKVTEAMLRIFNRQEELRANRARARIKFLIDRIGIDEFRKQVDEEMKGDWVDERDFDPDAAAVHRRRGGERASRARRATASPNGDAASSSAGSPRTSQPQQQEGFSTAEVRVIRGDLSPEQFRGLAADHARLHRRLRAHERPAEHRAALGPQREPLRRLAAPARSSTSAAPARTRSPTSSAAPAPTAASSASRARWA